MTEAGSFRSAITYHLNFKGVEMYKEDNKDEYRKPAKDLWHRYSLQGLTLKKFILVANKIIRGEFRLLK